LRGCDPGGNRHREFRLGVPKRFVAWHNHAMNFLLPVPTVELVTAECEAFDLEDSLAEEALCLLWEQFPRNTDIRHVLLKVLVLNKLYGTMIHDIEIETVAKHIVGLEIDQRIEEGDIQAVDLIADCPKLKKYVSFASKFCSGTTQRLIRSMIRTSVNVSGPTTIKMDSHSSRTMIYGTTRN